MKILVAYATTHGQTRRIARFAANWCAEAGHSVELLSLDDSDGLGLDRFDAVILAGSIHAGRYQKALTEFCAAQSAALTGRPGLFLSVSLSAAGHDSDDWKGLDRIIAEFREATGWAPDRVEQVAGAYTPSRYDVFSRFIMRRILALKDPDADLSSDMEYTDWSALRATLSDWAGHVGAMTETDN